jgi:ribosomal protein S27AE
MTVEAKKPEAATPPAETEANIADPIGEIAGLQAELAQLRRNYNVLDTAHKRAQKTIAKLQEEKSRPKEPSNATVPAAPSTTVSESPPKSTESIPISSTSSPSNSHVREDVHFTEWEPRYCPECGTNNAKFKDEVECDGCGIGLGSEDYARTKMRACPNCGNSRFRPVRRK